MRWVGVRTLILLPVCLWVVLACRYDGVWRRDEWHGRGVLYLPDKARFEGEFVRGKREGQGKLFNAQGTVE